jgi:hypothetical protein
MQLTVLMHGAADEPLPPNTNVRLTTRKGPVEAIRHKIVGLAEGNILAVDDDERQARSRGLGSLHQKGVPEPKPEAIHLQRALRPEAHRENSDLRDAGDVL